MTVTLNISGETELHDYLATIGMTTIQEARIILKFWLIRTP